MIKKGETIVVQHRTNGNGRYEACRVVHRIVGSVYGQNKVRDSGGDVWTVRRGQDGKLYTVVSNYS